VVLARCMTTRSHQTTQGSVGGRVASTTPHTPFNAAPLWRRLRSADQRTLGAGSAQGRSSHPGSVIDVLKAGGYTICASQEAHRLEPHRSCEWGRIKAPDFHAIANTLGPSRVAQAAVRPASA